MEYTRIELNEEFIVKKIITIHYYEFAKDFIFSGEKHDFWEFLYVDEGEVEVTSNVNGYVLHQGDMIFHKPNEFHSVWANKKIAPNVVVVCFECNQKSMAFFKDKIFGIGDEERGILTKIVREGFNAFAPPLGDPEVNILSRKSSSLFGSEQLIKAYLEILLITLFRNNKSLMSKDRLSSIAKERSDNDIIIRLTEYMEEKIRGNISLEEFCQYINMSRTHLTSVFKKRMGMGVVKYFRKRKMEYAKTLIREGNYNFTEIAELLGYSSIHYFSRCFKRDMGCTPTQYAKSISARI